MSHILSAEEGYTKVDPLFFAIPLPISFPNNPKDDLYPFGQIKREHVRDFHAPFLYQKFQVFHPIEPLAILLELWVQVLSIFQCLFASYKGPVCLLAPVYQFTKFLLVETFVHRHLIYSHRLVFQKFFDMCVNNFHILNQTSIADLINVRKIGSAAKRAEAGISLFGA